MKKLFTIVLIATITSAFAQERPQQRFADKLRFGGNLGLQFGTVTLVDVSPMVGYQASERFLVGVGGTYMYFQDKRYAQTYSSTYYGGRTFGQYHITPQLFAWAEYEALNGELWNPIDQELQRMWFDNFFVGGGFRQGPIMVTGLYNLSYETGQGFYSSPWLIRIGAFF